MKQIIVSSLIALLLTILIESFLAYILFKIKDKKDIINIILINALTNPLVNAISIYCLFTYGFLARRISLTILEILAFLCEALLYKKVLNNKTINPFILSLVLNLSSYLTGVLINTII